MEIKYFTVLYRDAADREKLLIEKCDDKKAAQAKKIFGSAQGMYLGAAYIRGTDIVKIEEDKSKTKRITGADGKQWCGKCENGWIIVTTDHPIYPTSARACSCNISGKEAVLEYQAQLNSQSWYQASQENERRMEHDKRFEDDPDRKMLRKPTEHELALASQKLAALLFPSASKTWKIEQWKKFNDQYPDPIKELENQLSKSK